MTLLISTLLVLLTVLLVVPAGVFAVECIAAALYPGAADRMLLGAGGKIRTVIVIPAHNEAAGIADTLAQIAPELSAGDSVIVVADNCDDATAEVAARSGARVLVRNDLALRGKGYALDFAVQSLRGDPPDVVIILDADCSVSAGAIRMLSGYAFAHQGPVQARYEMNDADAGAQTARSIAGFAWLVRGTVRPTGLAALGMPCQLYGTGMAFPWPVLRELALASGNIVEDMKLTLDLIDHDALPVFCCNASVISAFPAARDAADAQRRRWEHGHLATLIKYGLPAVAKGVAALDARKTMLALDICVPPLSLLVLLLAATSVVSLVAMPALVAARYTAAACLLAWVSLGGGLYVAWHEFGRAALSPAALLRIPAYAASKLPLYFKFLTARQKEWNRTDRK